MAQTGLAGRTIPGSARPRSERQAGCLRVSDFAAWICLLATEEMLVGKRTLVSQKSSKLLYKQDMGQTSGGEEILSHELRDYHCAAGRAEALVSVQKSARRWEQGGLKITRGFTHSMSVRLASTN